MLHLFLLESIKVGSSKMLLTEEKRAENANTHMFPGVQYGLIKYIVIYRSFRKDQTDLRNSFQVR